MESYEDLQLKHIWKEKFVFTPNFRSIKIDIYTDKSSIIFQLSEPKHSSEIFVVVRKDSSSWNPLVLTIFSIFAANSSSDSEYSLSAMRN